MFTRPPHSALAFRARRHSDTAHRSNASFYLSTPAGFLLEVMTSSDYRVPFHSVRIASDADTRRCLDSAECTNVRLRSTSLPSVVYIYVPVLRCRRAAVALVLFETTQITGRTAHVAVFTYSRVNNDDILRVTSRGELPCL